MSLPDREGGSVWLEVPFAAVTGVASVVATGAGELLNGSGSATFGVGGSLRGFCKGDMFSEV